MLSLKNSCGFPFKILRVNKIYQKSLHRYTKKWERSSSCAIMSSNNSREGLAFQLPVFIRKVSTANYEKNFSNDRNDIPEEERYIHKTEVERFIIDCMMKVGAEESRAKMLASNLTEADYVGHFSHGLNRLAVYVKDCQGGFCRPNNDPIVLKKGPATGWVDGNNGLGVVVNILYEPSD